MKTLEEHNKIAAQSHGLFQEQWTPSGVTCPECGSEMLEDASTVLTSTHSTRNVKCQCGFWWYKII